MSGTKKFLYWAVCAIVLLVLNAPFTFCQLNPSAASVALIATLESLSVVARPTIAISFTSGGVAESSFPLAITTAWAVPSNRTTLRMYSYVSNAPAELIHGGQLDMPTTFRPARTTIPEQAGVDLTLFTQPVDGTNNAQMRTDVLSLEIDPGSLPQLHSRAYGGPLNIRVEAF